MQYPGRGPYFMVVHFYTIAMNYFSPESDHRESSCDITRWLASMEPTLRIRIASIGPGLEGLDHV